MFKGKLVGSLACAREQINIIEESRRKYSRTARPRLSSVVAAEIPQAIADGRIDTLMSSGPNLSELLAGGVPGGQVSDIGANILSFIQPADLRAEYPIEITSFLQRGHNTPDRQFTAGGGYLFASVAPDPKARVGNDVAFRARRTLLNLPELLQRMTTLTLVDEAASRRRIRGALVADLRIQEALRWRGLRRALAAAGRRRIDDLKPAPSGAYYDEADESDFHDSIGRANTENIL